MATSAHIVPISASGDFQRPTSTFRDWISKEPGSEFPPEVGRYHIYISHACPWAHRTMIVRQLKGLEDIISVTSVHHHGGTSDTGWKFATAEEEVPELNVTRDPLHPDCGYLRDVYRAEQPDYNGRFSVPLLYDKVAKRIVNNESEDIIRMLYHEFDNVVDEPHKSLDLYPEALRKDIDESNKWIYDDINNGVYKSGFAQSQDAYKKAVIALFHSLERVENHLRQVHSEGPYFWGRRLSESDIRLFTTIVRFDVVYHYHFKCNLKDIRSGFPAIHDWLRHLYWDIPAFKETTHFEFIKENYTKDQKHINPFGITALGPVPHILPKGEEVESVKEVARRW